MSGEATGLPDVRETRNDGPPKRESYLKEGEPSSSTSISRLSSNELREEVARGLAAHDRLTCPPALPRYFESRILPTYLPRADAALSALLSWCAENRDTLVDAGREVLDPMRELEPRGMFYATQAAADVLDAVLGVLADQEKKP